MSGDNVDHRLRSWRSRDDGGVEWLHRAGVGFLSELEHDRLNGRLRVRMQVVKPADQLPYLSLSVGAECGDADPVAAAVWYADETGQPACFETRQPAEPGPGEMFEPRIPVIPELIGFRPFEPEVHDAFERLFGRGADPDPADG